MVFVVVHESHLVAPPIDSRDSLSERYDQVFERREQHVGHDGPFEMAPQPLDQVQARAVGRQPVDLDLLAVLFEPLTDGFGVMEPAIVADQANLATRIGSQQRLQIGQEVGSRLGRGNRVSDPAGGVVDSAIGDGFPILSRSGDLGLRADRSPDSAECWMAMNLDLVLVDQNFRGIGAGRFFFK
jgi:hypothetical protein